MPAVDKPIVLIIHGAWHQPALLQPLIDSLHARGHEGVCYQNPSSDHPPGTKRTPESPQVQYGLPEDVEAVRKTLSLLVERQKKRVFVLCHSWGGMICSEAIKEEFSESRRQQRGERGGVIGMMYMCAYLLPMNEKLVNWRAGGPNAPVPWARYDEETGLTYLKDAEVHMFNDLDSELQRKYGALTYPQSPAISKAVQTQQAYLHHPTTYLHCENDQAIPIAAQERMVALAKKHTEIREARCTASHSPHLSQPGIVSDAILAAIQWSSAKRSRL